MNRDECLKNHSCANCEALKKATFQYVTDLDAEEMNLSRQTAIFEAGQTLFEQGKVAQGAFAVRRGVVRILRKFASEQPITVRFATIGELVGVEGNQLPEKYTYSAEAMGPVETCVFPRDFVEKLFQSDKFLKGVNQDNAANLARVESMVCNFVKRSLRERIAFVLFELSKRFGESSKNGIFLNLPMTRKDLADLCGTGIESVSRTLSELHDEQLLYLEKRKIYIVNKDALAKLASALAISE